MENNKIILTVSTAIVHDNITPEQRIKEYKECFDIIKSFGFEDFHIVETVLEKSELLESYSKNVFYTNVNGRYNNRGSNYVNAYKKFLNESNFNDEDIIIHITGRYPLINDSFFKNCLNLDSDKIGCFGKDIYNQFYTFLYGMRFKQLKDLLNSINVQYMEAAMINLEMIFSQLIPHEKVMILDELGIIGRQSNDFSDTYGKIKF